MKIIELVFLNQYILMVFCSKRSCYQYSIIAPNGYVYEPDDIFPNASSADKEGRLVIQFTSY